MQNQEQQPHNRFSTLASAATVAGAAYLWQKQRTARNNDKPPHAPGPAGIPLLGNLPQLRHDQMNRFLQLQQQFGDVVRLEVGPRTLHLVSHPDLARHVLMKLQSRMSQ